MLVNARGHEQLGGRSHHGFNPATLGSHKAYSMPHRLTIRGNSMPYACYMRSGVPERVCAVEAAVQRRLTSAGPAHNAHTWMEDRHHDASCGDRKSVV